MYLQRIFLQKGLAAVARTAAAKAAVQQRLFPLVDGWFLGSNPPQFQEITQLQPILVPLSNTSRFSGHRRYFSTDATARPFSILGVQQVAIGNETRDPLRKLWQGVFGLQPSSSHTLPTENVQEDILEVGGVEIDLMTPIDPEKSPKVHVPPLNHIGLWVDDLPKAVEWMKANGVRFTPGGIRKGAAGYDVTFIHPKSNADFPISGNGVLIELVQAPPGVIEELSRKKAK